MLLQERYIYIPLSRVFIVSITIGIYIATLSLIAEQNAWSNFSLSLIFCTNASASILANLLLHKTALLSVHRRFQPFLGIGMGCVLLLGSMMFRSIEFWFFFSILKGLLHTNFYHGIRLQMTGVAENDSLMRVFSLKYITLCVGNIIGVCLVGVLPSLLWGLYCYAFCYFVLCGVSFWMDSKEESVVVEAPEYTSLRRDVLRTPVGLLLLCLLSGVLGETLYSFIIKIHLEDGYSQSFSLAMYNLLLTGAIVLQYPLASLQDKRPKLSVSIALGFAAMLLLGFAHSDSMILTSMMVFGIGGLFAALSVVGESCLCQFDGLSRSSALQLGALFYLIGDAIADPITGYVLDYGARQGVAYAFIFFILLMAWLFHRNSPKHN